MHVHKFRRRNIGRKAEYWVMQCALPGCTHYVPMRSKISAPVLLGKLSVCNKCGDRFELSRRALRAANPICNSCVQHKNEKLDEATKFFRTLEKTLGDPTGIAED